MNSLQYYKDKWYLIYSLNIHFYWWFGLNSKSSPPYMFSPIVAIRNTIDLLMINLAVIIFIKFDYNWLVINIIINCSFYIFNLIQKPNFWKCSPSNASKKYPHFTLTSKASSPQAVLFNQDLIRQAPSIINLLNPLWACSLKTYNFTILWRILVKKLFNTQQKYHHNKKVNKLKAFGNTWKKCKNKQAK